jgi:hypothetical protein
MRSPETARSIESERINPPSKSVDKMESAPLLEIFAFMEGPKYTPATSIDKSRFLLCVL